MVEEEGKSRTQLKKEATVLQKLGEKLISLNDEQLKKMELPSELFDAIRDIGPMKSHGARRRQLQYIGSLMRHVDVAPIERAIIAIEQGAYEKSRAFHRIERWRDQLMDGNDETMKEILSAFPHADRQRLGQLVRSARKEKKKQAPPKSARNLFRYLRELSSDRK